MNDANSDWPELLILSFVLPWLGAIGILGWQSFQWLRFGAWPRLDMLDLFDSHPYASWVGVQKLIDWWLGTSLSVNLFVIGLVLFVVAFRIMLKRTFR
jgi:hypothetical protein